MSTWSAIKLLLQCQMIRTQWFSVNTNSSTPCTTVRIKDTHFTGAAGSHSGVNIMSSRALERLANRTSSILKYYKCTVGIDLS